VLRYRLVLENGEPAEPPFWYTGEAEWQVGDWIIAKGQQYEVVAVKDADDTQTHALLVVKSRPLPGT